MNHCFKVHGSYCSDVRYNSTYCIYIYHVHISIIHASNFMTPRGGSAGICNIRIIYSYNLFHLQGEANISHICFHYKKSAAKRMMKSDENMSSHIPSWYSLIRGDVSQNLAWNSRQTLSLMFGNAIKVGRQIGLSLSFTTWGLFPANQSKDALPNRWQGHNDTPTLLIPLSYPAREWHNGMLLQDFWFQKHQRDFLSVFISASSARMALYSTKLLPGASQPEERLL